MFEYDWCRSFALLSGCDAFPERDPAGFVIILNDGAMQEFVLDGIHYELQNGELLIVLPYSVLEPPVLHKRSRLYYLEFYLDERFDLLPESNAYYLQLAYHNYFHSKQTASEYVRQLFAMLNSDRHAESFFGVKYDQSVLTVLLAEVLNSCDFELQKGIDWSEYHADGLRIRIENPGPEIALCLRFDSAVDNTPHNWIMCGSTAPLVVDEDGTAHEKAPVGELHAVVLPRGFRGWVYYPFDKPFLYLDQRRITEQFSPTLTRMKRLLYFLYHREGESLLPLKGGEHVALGAFSLVNAEEDKGRMRFRTVRSLSYPSEEFASDRDLLPTHIDTFFNRQYYVPQGMTISYEDGRIHARQLREGSPFLCTTMGCNPDNLSEYPQDILRALRYMRENPSQAHSVGELAKLCFLSESRFKNKFRRYVGISPIRYAENLRMEEARRRLRGTESITEIAFDLGFSSAPHFSSVFRQKNGITPSLYRKQNT